MIVGNVEQYIARCLNSFLPIADEVCIVRAIGNQQYDDTIDIAGKLCASMGKPFKAAEYYNKAGNASWPHVDDFGAARQMSFDLAEDGNYCFWCDSDDVLKQGADRIRQHARENAYACFMFPYDIFGRNVVVWRERMMLKGSGRWSRPVHENFVIAVQPPTVLEDETVIVQHLPGINKTGSNARNLRILESIPENEIDPVLKFHLFGELLGAGRIQDAVPKGFELLQDPKLGKDERYDVLLSLALQADDANQRVEFLHKAHQTDPERREALGVLSGTMIDLGRPAAALAYARQMRATTGPNVHPWNSRLSFYGYIGEEIYMQALRANGRFEDAETVRREALKRVGGPRIALLHTPQSPMAQKTRQAWHDMAEKPERVEHVFLLNSNDKECESLRRFHHTGAIATKAFESQMAIMIFDDSAPVPMWDKIALDKFPPRVFSAPMIYDPDSLDPHPSRS